MRKPTPAIDVFERQIASFLKLGRPRIAFGLLQSDLEILQSLEKSKRYADIVLVGPSNIKTITDFEIVVAKDPEKKLAELLVGGRVHGIIRGTLDDVKTQKAYELASGGERYTISPGLLQDPKGRNFFIGPVSNTRGWTAKERLAEAKGIADFVREWMVEPRIAVYAAIRSDTYVTYKNETGRLSILNKTYEDAEWIVAKLTAAGYVAKNWTVDLASAVEQGYNVHVPINGMVGNQIFRTFLFCGGKVLAATLLGLSHLYEDNSREEKDFGFHVKWLAALINKRNGTTPS